MRMGRIGFCHFFFDQFHTTLRTIAWFGRMNFNLEGAVGVDAFELENSDAQSHDFEKMSFLNPGIKVNAGLEFLVNPDLAFNIDVGYNDVPKMRLKKGDAGRKK